MTKLSLESCCPASNFSSDCYGDQSIGLYVMDVPDVYVLGRRLFRFSWWSVRYQALHVSINAYSYNAYINAGYTHNFIHLLKRQHSYTQKNESENLTNQQHKTLA